MREYLGRVLAWSLLVGFIGGCDGAGAPPRRLDELVLRDSTYLDPRSGEPFTGRVERRFREDTASVQLLGSLTAGTWSGELRVYHPNGSIRFLGSLHEGRPCGPWIEERPAEDPGSEYERLIDEIESLAVYEPCP